MTELRQRMIDAMVQRSFAASTQDIYVSAIRRMAKHYRRDPALYTVQEVQAYLLHLVNDRKLSYSTMNQAACAAQLLFRKRPANPPCAVDDGCVIRRRYGATVADAGTAAGATA